MSPFEGISPQAPRGTQTGTPDRALSAASSLLRVACPAPGHLPESHPRPRPACPPSARVAPTGLGSWGSERLRKGVCLTGSGRRRPVVPRPPPPWTASRCAFSGGFAEKPHVPGPVCCCAFEAGPSPPLAARYRTSLLPQVSVSPHPSARTCTSQTRSAFRACLRPCSGGLAAQRRALLPLGFEDRRSQS